MAKYNLEEFRNWLKDKKVPKNPWNWEKHLKKLENEPQKFAEFIEAASLDDRSGGIHYYDEVVNSVGRWKREKDDLGSSEDEVEAKKKKKNQR